MHPHSPPLVAARFLDLADGTALDLATGGRTWIARRALDPAGRLVWPDAVARLLRLWHPAMAPCVDAGWLGETEWFDAFAMPAAEARSPFGARSPIAATAAAFLRAHGVTCALSMRHAARVGPATLVPQPPDEPPGAAAEPGSAGLGMRLIDRACHGHLLAALDDVRGLGPRVWSLDAPPASGWTTTWRWLAREARTRGYVPIHARVLESAVRRTDGRLTSWLALLEGCHLLVLHECDQWRRADRQGLARLMVRLGGLDVPAVVVLDVVRRGRPQPAPFVLGPIPADELAAGLWVARSTSPWWLRARAIAEGSGGMPGAFVAAVARRIGAAGSVPSVHERAPAFATPEEPEGPTEVEVPMDAGGVIDRAATLIAGGRSAAAARQLQRAAWASHRRGQRERTARLLAELASVAAMRGQLELSRRYWRDATGCVSSAPAWLQPAVAMLAEQWIRQAALADAERLLRSAVETAALLEAPQSPALCALLTTCLCWQARWHDAARAGRAGDQGPLPASRVWARLEQHDVAGAIAELRQAAAGAAPTPDPALAAARLRVAVAVGDVDTLAAAADAPPEGGSGHRSLAADDRVLLPLEGLVRHGVRLSPAWTDRLRRMTRADVPRLVRARARLALALAGARPAERKQIAADVARVAGATGALALASPDAVVSCWPAPARSRTSSMLNDLVAVLRACQAHDDPRAALAAVCALLHGQLHASAVAVAGPPGPALTTLAAIGRCDLGPVARRAADAGQPVIEQGPGVTDAAVPVRLGEAVVGVLACRTATTAGGHDADRAMLEAAAIAIAPTARLAIELAADAAPRSASSPLLGVSRAMAEVRAAVDAAARVPFTVLVDGESGSGKELVAREVHRLGPRRARAFCAVNCAALTDDLCEAELFGHARGAFTGAVGDRAGLFEEADGGTLFLDEVSELSPRAQAKLLRAIQEGEIRRLGETRPRRVDVRLIAATNRPLADAVQAGAFRADLRYRLDVIHVTLPPLRERPDDVPVLARHYWQRAAERVGSRARLGPETLAALARYDWPGNVRELQNVLAALAAHAPRHGVVPVSALPAALLPGGSLGGLTLEQARRRVDERLVRAALAQTGGHRGRAASALGLTRQGLAKLVDRLELEVVANRAAPSP